LPIFNPLIYLIEENQKINRTAVCIVPIHPLTGSHITCKGISEFTLERKPTATPSAQKFFSHKFFCVIE
jgi:hypothetical protein